MLPRLRSLAGIALLVVLPTVILCLAGLEVGLRVLGRLPSNTTDGFFEASAKSYRLRKNITKVSRSPSFTCTIHTNELGVRDRAPGPRPLAGKDYYAFVGDSLTFGNGVEYEESFVGVVGALAASRGVEVVNLAIGGHRLTDQEERLLDFLEAAPARPSHVVLMITSPLLDGFELRHSDVFIKNGYLFHRGSWIVPYLTVTLGNTSAAYSFLRDTIRKTQERFFPSGAKVARELISIYARDAALRRPEVAARLEARLTALDGEIRRYGATPIYVYLPSSADLRVGEFLKSTGGRPEDYDFELYRDLLAAHAAGAGLHFVDLTGPLEREHAKGERMSFAQDMHYNVPANRAIGEALFAALFGGAAEASLAR